MIQNYSESDFDNFSDRSVPRNKSQAEPVHRKNQVKGVKVRKRFKLFSKGMGLDLPFLLLLLTLLVVGIVMMFSASYPFAYQKYGNSYYFLIRQVLFAAVGLTVMIALSYFDYHHFHKLAVPIMAAAWILMIIVLILPSDTDTKRWIKLGLFNVQPSEICKFALILFLANWGSIYYKKMHTIKYGVMPALVVYGVSAVLLVLEPHYSGIVIITFIVAFMLFLSGLPLKFFVAAGSAVASVIGIMAVTGKLGYAMSRLDGWGQALVYTDNDMWQLTWQTRNSLYAIGSGGLWGLGLGQSRQKYLYLPEPQNDFVFAIVSEELGLIGAFIVLVIFALFVWRGIKVSSRARDKFGTLLGVGLMAQIGLQVVLNILVITDWLPNTGISLPFFSYGGSSLMMLLAQMGIVLNISRSATLEKE